MKDTQYFFAHDCNARQDEKIALVRMQHGAEGYAAYFMTLEVLRTASDYMLSRNYSILSFDFHISEDVIKSVIEEFDLFEFTPDNRFYSSRMMRNIEKTTGRAKKAALARWSKKSKKSTKKAEDKHKVTIAEKIEACKKRKKEFYNEVARFSDKYEPEMLREFFDWFSELNKSGTKMKFEQNTTWETSKRLATWKNRDKKYGKNKNGKGDNSQRSENAKAAINKFNNAAKKAESGEIGTIEFPI